MALDLGRARRRLMAVGIEEDRADAIADVVAEATGDLATSQDIVAVKQDLAEVKAELKQDIADLKQEVSEMKAGFYRALWLQSGVLLTALLGVAGLMLTAMRLWM